jgi:hypothetical protein
MMGFAISWLAVKGKNKDQILAELDLRDSGEVDDAYEVPMSGAHLRDGWYMLFLNAYDHPFVQPAFLKDFSARCDVVACQVEEHVMASTAVMHADGQRLWRVHHEGDVRIENLTTEGALPANFAAIRDRLIKQQKDEGGNPPEVDYYFDIPLTLALSICGFKHDEAEFDWGKPSFTKLVPTKEPARKSIWPWRR